jgi:hypothetical protein
MEDNTNTTEEVGKVETQATEKVEETVEKFTQEQVNSMIKKEKIANKYKDIDIEAYKSWVESQKTVEQKQAEKEAEYLEKDKKITMLENKLKINEMGVNKEFSDFVLFTVSNMEGDFQENLIKFLEENPKYKGEELTERKATGAPVKSIGSGEEDGVLAILKSKHPEMKF